MLRKISEDIITTIQHADKLLKKPDIIIPQSYHMTLDYRGKLQNIEEYIQEIIARKIASKETTLWFPAMDEWRSNIDDRTIIHARPTRQQQAKIPFNVRE